MDFIQYHNSVAGNRCQVHKIKREKAIAGDIIDEKIMRKRLKRVRQAILFTRFALASARSFHALRGASSPLPRGRFRAFRAQHVAIVTLGYK